MNLGRPFSQTKVGALKTNPEDDTKLRVMCPVTHLQKMRTLEKKTQQHAHGHIFLLKSGRLAVHCFRKVPGS